MKPTNIIIRFSDATVQPTQLDEDEVIQRIVGFVEAKNLLPLFDEAGLDANPRSAKFNGVVTDILGSLEESPELFHFKSKGVLLGTSSYEALQRNRYSLRFGDPSIEGILDGGHNMLAIGLHVLGKVMDEDDWKKLKNWDQMKLAWDEYRESISQIREELDFRVPVELLVPTSDDEDTVESFVMSLLGICAARNNNAQLTQEAKANKRGFYDAIRALVPDEFAHRVEWRPNTWEDESEKRPIKIRDLIALGWIPLNLLNEEDELPIDVSVTPQNIYRNKGECSAKFDELMEDDDVTEQQENSRHLLVHKGVESAFKILADLPDLYDQIYKEFPEAYNSNGYRFGSKPIVKLYEPERRKQAKAAGKDVSGYTTTQPRTPFMRHPVTYNYPEGLIIPLVYGLKGLMEVKNGKVVWAVDDPAKFLRRHLKSIAGTYTLVLDMGKWDPQKISKNPASHEFAVNEFRRALAEERLRAKA